MPHNHFKEVCTCGVVIKQCKCMSKDKTILTVKNGCVGCRALAEKPNLISSTEFACYEAKVIKETPFRSKAMVNMDNDMVKVELTMGRNNWRQLKKKLNS